MINGTEIKALCVQEFSAVYRERKRGQNAPFCVMKVFRVIQILVLMAIYQNTVSINMVKSDHRKGEKADS